MYKNSYLLEIINRQLCYFISPHLDDAILSAGELIYSLSKKKQVKVITIFSKASPQPYTLFSRRYLHTCHYQNADTFFEDRKTEDRQLFRNLNIRPNYLDFIDAGWRKKTKYSWFASRIPELIHLYPTRFQILSGRVSYTDRFLIKKIQKNLLSFIPNPKNIIIFCPLGIGNHVDHVITREVCRLISRRIIYWTDYPYFLRNKFTCKPDIVKNMHSVTWNATQSKLKLITAYKSQLSYLFHDKPIKIIPEKYYFDEREFL